jgi:hypothetical protein
MQLEGCWASLHATKENIPCMHAASLLAVGGTSMPFNLHNLLKKSSSAITLSSESSPGCVGVKLSAVRSLRAWNPENVRRRQGIISSLSYGSCCVGMGQINRTHRWRLVASMTHAACSRVPVLHRAPRLRCHFQRVCCSAPFRLLKL